MKIFILKLLVLVSFALSLATMAAGNVDSRTAQAKAIQFLNSQTDMRFNASNANLKLTHAEQSRVNDQLNDFYVFNCDGGGYVIVAGDDRAEEILGYGSGYFDMNNLPDNVAWWMNHYKEQMEYLLAHPKLQVQTLSQQMLGKLTASDVPAMLTCKWDQAAPFYNQCPIYNYNPNIHCLTGAVATAMAQVMYYWKYPAELPALDAYEIENNSSIIVEELPGITLDWDNMRDDYSSSYTTLQADAVAWLMRYCSQAVQTQYSTRFSYADKVNIRDAMINFGYSTDATIKYRDDYDATDWHAMMQAELEAGRPILYGGMALNNNIYEDHTFVVDGYNASSNKYHVNFGWSGMYNSFFALDAFIVYDNYSAGGYTFNLNQMMFIGVYPDNQEPEAYACYTPENTTLTFYYDDQRNSREGTTYDLNTGFINPGWVIDGTNANVTKVVFDPSFADARPTSTYTWFYLMSNLQSITGIGYLNTSQVTNMGLMFNNCSSLTSLDLTHFNTENVNYMNDMFYYCINLKYLDLSSFNTANVARMEYMFGEAYNLARVVVGNEWSTTAVTNSDGMFFRCFYLVGGQGTTYDENHVDAAYAHIDGGPSNPGYFTDASATEAYACYTPENTTLTFYCDNQRYSRLGRTYDLNTDNNKPRWFNDGTNVNVTKVVFDPSFANARPTTTYDWFCYMMSLESITGISYLNTSEVTSMNGMFEKCQALTSLDVSSFNTANVTNMSYMFRGCQALTSLDLGHFNTSNVTLMNNMFDYCQVLTRLDVSSFNTSNVTDMSNMFYGCRNLTTIYVGNEWSTAAVTSSYRMFYQCTNLVGSMGTTFDSNYTDKTYAHIDGGPSNPGYLSGKPGSYAVYTAENTTLTFYCDNQRNSRPGTAYDLNTGSNNPGWYDDDTRSSVTQVVFDPSFAAAYPTTTSSWFRGMYNLQSISGMEYLNTEEVTNMSYMFNQCIYLSSLDLSHFNTAKVTDMTRMFDYCTQLFLVYVGSAWNTDAVTQSSNMFRLCNKLKGGQGTYFSSNNPKDKTYAHIDGGPSNPGYFRDYSISEAYTIYTEDNQTLTFYYDTNRLTRPGTTYDVFPNAGWYNKDLVVKYVVFDQSFELAKPTSTSSWFSEMGSLESITGIRYLKTDSVTDMSYMFFECGLSDLEMNNYLSYFNTAKVKRMEWMFHSCKALTTLDLTNFNTANVTDMSYMFDGCNDLTTIYVGDGWSNESVTNSEKMFMYCLSLVGGQGTTFDYDHVDGSYAHIDGGPSNPGYFTAPIVPSEPEAYACYTPDNTTLTFYYDDQRGSRLGTTYDLNVGARQPDWVLDETNYSVTQVVIDPSFVEARPTSTYSWFFCMENVQSITGLDYLNTDSVTNMAAMFMGSASLTSLDLSHFNTTMVTDMFNMFYECSNLASLDVSGFNTAQVRDMRGMFQGCSMLTSLDLSSFNTARVGHMGMMFLGDSHLSTIYVGSSWSTESINYSAEMFLDCTSLVGGKGTTYDANHVDVEYAHIDGGTSNPGYFTAKVDFIPGDVNGDNSTSISDVTDLIDVLLSGETAPQAADCNGDSNVSISDVTALIDYLLGGSWN